MPGKTNTFSFVYFVDSISDAEMFERLEMLHFQAAVSPLHDADVWTRQDVLKRIYRKVDQVRIDTGSNRDVYGLLPRTGEQISFRKGDLEYFGALPCYLFWPRYARDSAKRPDEERYCFWRCPIVGELKKPHRHVIIRLDYSTSWDTLANKLCFEHSRIGYIEPVGSRDALLRYFCHLDSPDKALYPRSGVISFGGYSTDALFKSDEVAKDGEWSFIYDLVRSTPTIRNVKTLCDALNAMNEPHLARVVFAQSPHWAGIINDTRSQRRGIEDAVIDPMTGEYMTP